MQTERFFEDRDARNQRRLLLGVAICEGDWITDGGRREAVRIATLDDARRYPEAYRDYYEAFQQRGEEPANFPEPESEETAPVAPAVPEEPATEMSVEEEDREQMG